MLCGSRTCAFIVSASPILNRAYAPELPGWAADVMVLVFPSYSPGAMRMHGPVRFSAFAELTQTTDCARQEGKANQQESDPEAAGVPKPVVDSQLDI
jgi:hypothetical protein